MERRLLVGQALLLVLCSGTPARLGTGPFGTAHPCSCTPTLEANSCLDLSQDYTKEERKDLAHKSRLGPPSFGSAERQKVSQELHDTMIAAEQQVSMAAYAGRAVCSSVLRIFATVH